MNEENMGRKVFISILGTGLYEECKYVFGDFVSSKTNFIQQATLEYIGADQWDSTDSAIIFLTQKAEETNWNVPDNKRKNFRTGEMIPYNGLKSVMEKMNLPFLSQSVSIQEGKDEKEMWNIFSTLYGNLQDGDELYIDLTHSFRYLPMLMLVLSNYSKFLKNTKIISLTYGNFEARNYENNKAPIVDLLPISALQDWTFAAADFLKNGNADQLRDLSSSIIKPLLINPETRNESAQQVTKLVDTIQLATEDIQTCRGMNIINSTNISKVKKILSEIDTTFIEPLNPIIKKIADSFSEFDNTLNIHNGFVAAEWCYRNGLYQQAVTILQENIVSYFCDRHSIRLDDEDTREAVNQSFKIISDKIQDDENKWKAKCENRAKIREILKDELLKEETGVVAKFNQLTDTRNDINHSGMRSKSQPLKSRRIITKIEEALLFFQNKLPLVRAEGSLILINLSNHPYDQWSEEQKKDAQLFGECLDLPFPIIDPMGDEEYVEDLVKEYHNYILELRRQSENEIVVHLMGEMTFVYSLLEKLRQDNIRCIASTTERQAIDKGNGQKESQFVFSRFRNYF